MVPSISKIQSMNLTRISSLEGCSTFHVGMNPLICGHLKSSERRKTKLCWSRHYLRVVAPPSWLRCTTHDGWDMEMNSSWPWIRGSNTGNSCKYPHIWSLKRPTCFEHHVLGAGLRHPYKKAGAAQKKLGEHKSGKIIFPGACEKIKLGILPTQYMHPQHRNF